MKTITKKGFSPMEVAKMLGVSHATMSNEAIDMCQKEGLSAYVELLDRKIREIYHNVSHIRHRTLILPDSPEHQRLRFEIHISGNSTQILSDERKFHAKFFELVPEEKQEFFSFTYRVKPI